ncbi:Protein kinase domain-containing protein [Mycena sanguinolenta]|uniref:Protein kinase domain-containing protein n=1 Tax=Mycena sanguinolenta TaxID=230812 RepID=A0A8H7DJC4_9AGAR|nr:Protein kinase domain-containing protein [Mycena sanguinolenta]
MNIHGAQPTIGQGSNPLRVLESGLNASTGQLVGVQRHGQQAEAARMVPDNLAHRRPCLSPSDESSDASSSASVSSPSRPLASPSWRRNSDLPLLGAPRPSSSNTPDDPDPSRANHPARRAIEYSSTYDQGDPGRLPQGLGHQNRSNPDVALSSPFQDHPRISIAGNVNQIQHHGERGFHILHRAAAADAFYDSAERFPQPRCHPETRKEMLEDLWRWSSSTDTNSSIFWLHGPAGAGKSAIAQSFCQKLAADRLGASFFFKRGNPSRGSGNKLFPTLAYQLAIPLPAFKETVSLVMEDDPSIIDRELSTQLQKLIIEPSRKTIRRTLVIVIDGLDECEGKEIQCEILRSIGNAIHDAHLSLRFFIASRPEPHIRETFTDTLQGIHCSVNINQSFDDVWRYFVDEFARIHREHRDTMARILLPWPAPQVVESLVQKSSGYFVYASIVVKFIDDKDFRPTERLDVILGTKEAEDESPFAALDQLYIQILSQVRARPRLLRVLTVIAAKLDLSLGHIEQLLGLELGDVRLTLRGLQSVIGLEDPVHDYKSPPVVHHASFYDFLQNPRRSGCFYIGSTLHKMDLSHCIFKAFSHHHTATIESSVDCRPWLLDLRHALLGSVGFWSSTNLETWLTTCRENFCRSFWNSSPPPSAVQQVQDTLLISETLPLNLTIYVDHLRQQRLRPLNENDWHSKSGVEFLVALSQYFADVKNLLGMVKESAKTALTHKIATEVCEHMHSDLLAVVARLVLFLRDQKSYKIFLACRGTKAQELLDFLQDLLDLDSFSLIKPLIFQALQQLSCSSGLHPRCFVLSGLQRLGQQVGAGSFGDIYKGLIQGQNVCAKVMRLYCASDVEAAFREFGQEAAIWRQLHHPNILPFFGLYHVDDRLCLVSPWMEDGYVTEFIRLHNPTSIKRLSFILDVALGLRYLHEQRVVHGDLTGPNILVTPSHRACITDFGLSSIADNITAQQAGAMRYQAPELLQLGPHKIHYGSDIYAFACVCYEILTGQVPFHELRITSVVIKVVGGYRPSRPTSSPGVFDDLWELLRSCWEEEAEKRPTAVAVVKRLEDPLIGAKPTPLAADWDETFTSKFRRSVDREPLLPSVAQIERILFGDEKAQGLKTLHWGNRSSMPRMSPRTRSLPTVTTSEV